MLEMSWITAILQLYSQVADLFGNVIVKRINIRLFDSLARFHYILNLPRMVSVVLLYLRRNENRYLILIGFCWQYCYTDYRKVPKFWYARKLC